MNYLLYFLYLGIVDYLLHYLLNRHNGWDLDHPFHYLLHDFRNLHNFLIDLKDFQDIINRNRVSDFFVNHLDDLLIYLRSDSSLGFHLFELQ
jgi:hypothetical protein